MVFNPGIEVINLRQGANPVRVEHVGEMIKLAETHGWRVIGVLPTEFKRNPTFPDIHEILMAALILAK